MASMELLFSESEWQSLFLFREYAKSVFDVDITRKDISNFDPSGGLDGSDQPEPCNHPPAAVDVNGGHKNKINASLNSCYPLSESISYSDFILRPPPVIVLLATTSSVENLEKCKKFTCAFTPANPDYRRVILPVESHQLLEMVRDSVPNIQRSTASVISIHPEQLAVSIQGHRSCVENATEKVKTVFNDFGLKSLQKNGQFQDPFTDADAWSKKHSPNELSKTTSDQNIDLNCVHIVTSDGLCNDEHSPYNLSSFSDALPEKKIPCETSDIISSNSLHQRHRVPCENSCEGSSSSEEDNVLIDKKVKKPQQVKDLIAQASKWGFTDQQIMNVFKRVGFCCSTDNMMRELIKEQQEDDSGTLAELLDCPDTALMPMDEESDNEDFDVNDSSNLRHIIIDGSNVAMSHGQKVFSCMGIKIVVDWFKQRGHKDITVFVPLWRKEASRPDAPISDQEILVELEKEKIVVFTPSRRIAGSRIVCYDDRYVLKLAVAKDGIVVSNDVYRDLVREREDFAEVVKKRLLMYSFVKDEFMPPEDPLGRQGPSLDNFLRIRSAEPKYRPQNCPYGKKCTYGNKCKYYHPERGCTPQKMVAERLKENAEIKLKLSSGGQSWVEKGRQPKLKLARTVSLVPQELNRDCVMQEACEEKSKKPPRLQHSKSVDPPSSYLTESRLKMEQAESEDILPKVLSVSCSPVPVVEKSLMTDSGKEFGSSPAPSGLQSGKSKTKAGKSFASSPSPTLSPFPESRDQSLQVSGSESQGMLGGHVHVAKRLSDEENRSGNFFSQHTSRGGSTQDVKGNSDHSNPVLSQESIRSPVPSNLQTSTPVSVPLEEEYHHSQQIFLPPKITEVTSPTEYNQLSREERTLSPPSLSRGAHPSPSPTSPLAERFVHFPPSCVPNQQLPPTQHLHYQRSLSSVDPGRSLDYLQKYSDRKHSLASLTGETETSFHRREMANLRSNLHAPYSPQAVYQPRLTRSQGSFDSGVYSSDTPGFLFSPSETLESPIYYNPQSTSAYASPVPHSSPMAVQPPGLVYQPGHQPFAAQTGGYGPQPSQAFSQPSPWQWQRESCPNTVTFDPVFQGQCLTNPHRSDSTGIYLRPSQAYDSPGFTTGSPARPQPQVAYHTNFASQESRFYPTMQGSGGFSELTCEPSTQLPPFSHPPPYLAAGSVVNEEMPISINDPRYPIYYNLSSVFGERVVRTFMNRNPDVMGRNIKELYNLILNYKQDRGM